MIRGLFQSSTIPILDQMAQFAQQRHTVLAGNLANLGTPGYEARDLSVTEFQTRLKRAIEARRQPPPAQSPGLADSSPRPPIADVAKNPKSILFHDQSDSAAEVQVTEMVKNQMQHNMALAIMAQQFRLLHAAVAERA